MKRHMTVNIPNEINRINMDRHTFGVLLIVTATPGGGMVTAYVVGEDPASATNYPKSALYTPVIGDKAVGIQIGSSTQRAIVVLCDIG